MLTRLSLECVTTVEQPRYALKLLQQRYYVQSYTLRADWYVLLPFFNPTS